MNTFLPTRSGLFTLALGAAVAACSSAVVLSADSPVTTTRPAASTSAATHPAPATTNSAAADKERKKQEEIERVMAFLQDTQPDVYEQAKTLRGADPSQFEKLIQNAAGTVSRLEELKKKKPQIFELTMKDLTLNYKSLRLARELRKPDLAPDTKDQLIRDMQTVVTDEFDVRQKIRQFEIDEQAARLKALDQQLKDRDKDKDQLIKKRVDDLQAKTPRLEW